MANLVLVHGAWMGAWCWRRVVPRLRAAGHEVFTPTLTGLGEMSHLLDRDIDLDTHVQDLVNFIDFQDLDEVVLVAHSYGGLAAGVASHRIPNRIRQLVYVDAYVPLHDKSFFDLQAKRFRDYFRELAAAEGEGWKIPAIAPDGESLGVSDPDTVAWAASKMTPHPLRTLETPAVLENPAAEKIPRSYIFCTENPPDGTLSGFAAEIRKDPRWRYLELTSPHGAMLTVPDALADRILEALE